MTHRFPRAACWLLLPVSALGGACSGASDDRGAPPSAAAPATGASGGSSAGSSSTGGASDAGAAGKGTLAGGAVSGGGHAGTTGQGSASAGGGGMQAAGMSGGAGSGATSGAGGSSGGSSTGGAAMGCVEGAPCDDGNSCTVGDTCITGDCRGAPSPDCGPVVHEWGTYTSVRGSDGITRGGVHHVDEALPTWVHRRNLDNPQSYFFEALPEEPRQQLETPVLYFHSPVARDITVEVTFPEGIVGEWYPEAVGFTPAVGQMTSLRSGSMTWDLTLDSSIDPHDFPSVSPDEIWAPSRQVTSTPVRSRADGASTELEQFLFYRGLAVFDPPIVVTTDSAGMIHIGNSSTDDLEDVFLLRATENGGSFLSLGALPAGGSLVAPIPVAGDTLDDFLAQARSGLHAALVATGLYGDEAQAMVDTWTRSWFRNVGVRVLYAAPRRWTDAWLPMKVTPAPAELVRTLVGRVEVMTIAEENALVAAAEAASEAGMAIPLAPLGRFAEPRLERAVTLLTGDAKALAESTRAMVHATP